MLPNIHDKAFLDSESQDFNTLYLDNFHALHRYAYTILNDNELAEEMVHQVFLKILERKAPLDVHTSFKAYLYKSVNNECLNYIKHQAVEQTYQLYATNQVENFPETPSSKLRYKELELHLKRAINNLPEQCRTIFQLSRFEELKYVQIANQLGISIKTVEAQMSKALKRLRVELADYLPLIIWLLIIKFSK
ncbi:RNA polymerase sigma-70 factor [Pedobacter petrophilus]|uniref:RNA polymerase sigma-70 factor n=1 Tax=Pedobacter petrophilus TaxID=1908241 RepID=A0A7K0G4W7_9SPHI|nr:RNA polymerase sigma-70 factor [Pedobacter petrophilus]MRX78692.1 RNA polymerase sigma-70 factor [Pedobacter petrophilus]